MFWNYFKIAVRNIIRNKVFSSINVVGLSIGIACFIFISLWIDDELSYEAFHENLDQIYQVNKEYHMGDEISTNPSTPYPLTMAAKERIPEVTLSTHFYGGTSTVKYGEKIYNENRVCFTDSSFFSVFTFDFIQGDPATALSNPATVVITEKIAHKYFSGENAMGKTLTLRNRMDLMVVGVIRDIPSNTTFQYEIFAPIDNITEDDDSENWGSHWLFSYLLLREDASRNQVEEKLTGMIRERLPNEKILLKLQPLKDLHLFSIDGNQAGIKFVIYFSLIAIFILLIACINYMNLSTARSSKRELEIGIRKTIGASREHLIRQFLIESFLFTLISMLFAIIIVELCRPAFNSLTGKLLVINYFNIDFLLILLGLFIITGMTAGSYPALALSRYKVIDIFHGNTGLTLKRGLFRKGLVIVQFVVTIVLMSGTTIILMQLKYIRNRDPGYNLENLMYLSMNRDISENYPAFKKELLRHQGIVSVGAASELPGETWNIIRGIVWEGKETDDGAAFGFLAVDEDYFATVQTELIDGKNFQSDFEKDSVHVILNHKAIEVMKMSSPVGGQFDIGDDYLYEIIGVTESFHSLPATYKIEPMVMMNNPRNYRRILIRMDPDQLISITPFIEQLWKEFAPENPFEYHFLDDRFERIYGSEIRAGKIFGGFVVIGVLISALGLFGLTSFITERRNKEIGIRKACGARAGEIIFMLSKEIAQWVIISIAIAVPVTLLVMSKWLQNFEYRTNLSWWIFVLTGLSALIIALLTVSYQSFSAANRNPVESLRYE